MGQGEILGILGPNGAGKTTLFNLVAGTVRPDSGSVRFKGRDITRAGVAERCRMGISRSFQIPHPVGGMSVYENVLVGATFGRLASAAPETRPAAVLEQTGLHHRANALAGSLTLLKRKRLELARALATDPELLLDEIAGGLTEHECQSLRTTVRDVHASGQQEMVAIGRALISNPDLILLDELSLGLAPIVIRDIYAQLPRITAGGMSAILVEQDVTRALGAAAQFICLAEGRVTLAGNPTACHRDQITAAYFGT